MYTGAQSISSAQYFGDGSDARGAGAGGAGDSADELIGRLGMHMRQELSQVSTVAKDVGRRFGDFVSNLNKY
jgi:hypothetical protein